MYSPDTTTLEWSRMKGWLTEQLFLSYQKLGTPGTEDKAGDLLRGEIQFIKKLLTFDRRTDLTQSFSAYMNSEPEMNK